ncbi:smoothened homolog [Paramuricea clavata]|uniref:Protein smoothened n=1 Tax=Paramuricea clavata TaxID=317549 RepID=A0A6S7GXP3_PARCT|nr:smoothened homolog [Paramuricea clavata]
MDITFTRLWTFVLLCAHVKSLNNTFKCEKLKQDTGCFDITLPFNYTTTEIATDSKDQKEIIKNLERWKALSFLPRCWEILKPLLCRVYMPKCEEGNVRLPCRSVCLLTREPCRVVEQFDSYGGWPEFLKCEAFPLENCDNLTISKNNQTTCPAPLVYTEDEESWYEGIHGCGIQCENPIFTAEEHDRIHQFIGAFGTFSILCTAFTVLTFLVGWKSQNKYPSVILFYMNACFCLTYLGFLVQFFGESRTSILCRNDNTMRLGEPVGTDSVSCIFTFFLVYYFSTAGVVWFVVLSYAWYICFQSLGTTRDDLSSKAVYFHLMSWIPPLVLTCVVISLAQVDGNSLSGICFVGYRNMEMRIYFLLAPLGINLAISGTFLTRGLLILWKLRKTNPHFLSQRSASRIKETIVRIGIFAFLAFIFVGTTFACHLYDYHNQKIWERGYRQYMKCIADATIKKGPDQCKAANRPDLGIIELHLFSLFGAGITMSAWTWTSSTLSSWKTAWDRLTGKRRYPELSHYNLIRRMRAMRKMQSTVRPAVEPIQEKSTENKITTPAPLNEESLQLQSIISDISVISDPKLLIPAKTNLKRVRLETGEPNHES